MGVEGPDADTPKTEASAPTPEAQAPTESPEAFAKRRAESLDKSKEETKVAGAETADSLLEKSENQTDGFNKNADPELKKSCKALEKQMEDNPAMNTPLSKAIIHVMKLWANIKGVGNLYHPSFFNDKLDKGDFKDKRLSSSEAAACKSSDKENWLSRTAQGDLVNGTMPSTEKIEASSLNLVTSSLGVSAENLDSLAAKLKHGDEAGEQLYENIGSAYFDLMGSKDPDKQVPDGTVLIFGRINKGEGLNVVGEGSYRTAWITSENGTKLTGYDPRYNAVRTIDVTKESYPFSRNNMFSTPLLGAYAPLYKVKEEPAAETTAEADAAT